MHTARAGKQRRGLLSKAAGWLTAPRNPWLLFAATAAAVVFIMGTTLGSGFISGNGAYWQHPHYDDNAHVSGWLYFKDDSWRFPLLSSERMNYPDGASAVYTDSIPLVAAPLKLFSGVLPGTWHYFGWFTLVSYVLTSAALLWLLRQLGVSSVLGAAFAVVFTCYSGLYNIQFTSLFAHFLVIFSLGFYFRLGQRYNRGGMALFLALTALSLLIHTYLFAMCLLIFGVTLVTLWRRGRLSLAMAGAWAAALGACVVVLAGVSGLLAYKATGYQEMLYGTSPVLALDPAGLFQKRFTIDEIGVYAGWGAWIILAAGAIAYRRRLVPLLRRHAWLAAAAAGLLLFALSNTLFFNGHAVFHIPLPAPLLAAFEMFRGSKRFIIVLYYLGIVGGFVALVRSRSKFALAVIIVALVVQVMDLQFFMRYMHTTAAAPAVTVLDDRRLRAEMAGTQIVNTYPSYSCLFNYRQTPLTHQWNASLEIYHMTAEQHLISNSARTARRSKDCTREARTARRVPPAHSLNFYLQDDRHRFINPPPEACLQRAQPFGYGVYCRM